jgi:hypothetical protein
VSGVAEPPGVASGPRPALRLVRWTCNTGSATQSRAAVVIESGEHRWQASAEGNGPVDAVLRAVDSALQDVLAGRPRLLSYDVHALGEGTDAVAAVRITIAPPEEAPEGRTEGSYEGTAESPNLVAASVEAYVEALTRLLADERWAGATDEAGNRRAVWSEGPAPRPEYDHDAPLEHNWFER